MLIGIFIFTNQPIIKIKLSNKIELKITLAKRKHRSLCTWEICTLYGWAMVGLTNGCGIGAEMETSNGNVRLI